MILSDQPTCFPEGVLVNISSKVDGTMLNKSSGRHAPEVVANRVEFCKKLGVDYGKVVYQQIVFGDDQTYDKIDTVGKDDVLNKEASVKADAIFTSEPGVGLFLPVADCLAMVFYDTKLNVLALAHIGRHSSYAKLAAKVVEHYKKFGSDPSNITVWMSPHAGKDSYKLSWFDQESDPDWNGYCVKKEDGYYLDMAGYNKRLLQNAGVKDPNIYISSADTVTDANYFSHSDGDVHGRFAVLASIL